jgi:hypothetical protein
MAGSHGARDHSNPASVCAGRVGNYLIHSEVILNLREFLGYAVCMRFRAKFGALGWIWVFLACDYIFDLIAGVGHKSTQHPYLAVLYMLLASQVVLNHFLTYWEMDSSSLRVRYFWTTREIAWAEVTHVGGANGRPSSGFLDVYYARPAPMSERGHFLANPNDRRAFVEELRKFAPQAEFEV